MHLQLDASTRGSLEEQTDVYLLKYFRILLNYFKSLHLVMKSQNCRFLTGLEILYNEAKQSVTWRHSNQSKYTLYNQI